MQLHNLSFTTNEEAIKSPDVLKKYTAVVDEINQQFNHVEQIKKFELLPYEWSVEGGELTPTLKLKRKVIMEKYKDAIERIFT